MKSILLILTFGTFSFLSNAYPDNYEKKSIVQQLTGASHSGLSKLIELYQQCNSSSEALRLKEELDHLLTKAPSKSLNHIAAASRISTFGDHSTALQQLRKLSVTLHSESAYIKGEYYVTIGEITYRSENPTSAIQHIQKGIGFLEKSGEKEALQIAYISLGLAYGAIDQHEKALVYYDQAERSSENASAKVQLYLQLNRALSLTHLRKHDLSKNAFHEALDIIRETKDYFAEVRTYGNLADIYLLEDSLDVAMHYLLKGRKLAVEKGFKLDLIRFDLTLSELHKRQGNYENAFIYLKSHDSIRNSVHIEKAAENAVELEKINQKTIHRLKQNAFKRTIELKKQKNWILWGSITLLSILCAVLLRQFLIIKKKNRVLLRKNLTEENIDSITRIKNKNTLLSEEDLTLIKAFEDFLIGDRAFRKPDLTQDKIAKKLGTNRTYLSKAINEHYGISYSRWLNELRISESKKMLIDKKFGHYSIEGIATSVGFSSLSTFNSNFKSLTGLTPSYFRKNYLNN
ncbi:MAG: helix-turn-helix domain-containing protein [Crocinitomicaceae bacterium]